MEAEKFSPIYSGEAAPLRSLIPRFEKIIGHPPTIDGVLERNPSGEPTRAWKIKLNQDANTKNVSQVLLSDWDDTLEPYSQRKQTLYSHYRELLPDIDPSSQDKVIEFCKSLNKAARILPVSGSHPERYSPLVEIMATSELFKQITAHSNLEALLHDTSEDAARSFIGKLFASDSALKGVLEIKTEMKDGKPKQYFREVGNQAAAVDFEKKPAGVSEDVWNVFKKSMTEAAIPDIEYDNFDLSDDVYWAISTFGEVNFQLEKVLNTLAVMKQKHLRLPDEVVLFTRGRKEPVIRSIAKAWIDKGVNVAYLDDSVGQLKRVVSFQAEFGNKFMPLRAQRAFSKRSIDPTPEGIRDVYLGQQTLSHIVDRAFKSAAGPLPSEYL